MNEFEALGLSTEIVQAVEELGFKNPTPIQAKTIPLLLSSERDIIASAQTGTGKTGAFGLPAVFLADPTQSHTQIIILAPTRELCIQISKDLMDYAKHLPTLNIVPVYGGANISSQIRELRKGAPIVVATPGRAIDLVNRGKLVLDQVSRLVLDEADEMLTMGFKEELETLLGAMPDQKQVLLFSATMSKAIMDITKRYMKNPEVVSVDKVNTAAKNVTHSYYKVLTKYRYDVIKRIADLNPDIYAIIFCRTRAETKEVSNKLLADGYNADALHGDLSQGQRDEVMSKFRNKILQILVATDVASRGLDVNDLTHVINYRLPDDPEVYIHRSGRTGRAGKSGESIAIINSRETKRLQAIEKVGKFNFELKDVPTGIEICSTQLLSFIDKIVQTEVNEKEITPFLGEIYQKLEHLSREELIQKFVSAEFNRFLEYYKEAGDINLSSKDKKSKTKSRDRDGGKVKFTRLFINLGKKTNLTPKRLIGIINNGLDSSEAAIGNIEILKKFTFFELESNAVADLIESVNNKTMDGLQVNIEVAQPKSYDKFGQPKEMKRNFKKKSRNFSKRR